jgi:threonine synthase
MLYYSTNHRIIPVSLKEAVIGGLAPDGGLYMPVELPRIPDSYFETIQDLSFPEIALDVALAFLGEDVPAGVLSSIVNDSFDFPVPIEQVQEGVFSLELYHGPTMAFKDFGARFMSRLMSYLYRDEDRALNVVVATSGDTGSAVAAGFHNVQGINVFVLFPRGQVSRLQQKQITTWEGNIHAIEVDGTFDDCQDLAKQLLGDPGLKSELSVTSANSINISRLIPQSFYYFYTYSQLKDSGLPLVFSVPSGNFGNLTGGLMARAAGLPVHRFIAATNINDVFGKFIDTGRYNPVPSRQTMSSAMDVGNPSNFARISEMMGNEVENFRKQIVSYSFSDEMTGEAIARVHREKGYLMDPHGAVAFLGIMEYLGENSDRVNSVFLETAHPAKFPEMIKTVIDDYDFIPEQLKAVLTREEMFLRAGNDLKELRSFILDINKSG